MRGDLVTGLIDFYFACTDIRAYDLAIMHTAWSFDATGNDFQPAVGKALIAGYEQAFGLLPEERDALASGAGFLHPLPAIARLDWLNTRPGRDGDAQGSPRLSGAGSRPTPHRGRHCSHGRLK